MALKILLADDSMTAQNMGKKILTEAGYEVVAVSNGAQAVKKIASEKPGLAILDVFMPGYTGVEVCERVKKAQETAQMPVLLTIGKMELGGFKPEEGTRAGADALIVKPFEASDLLAAVKKIEENLASAAAAAAAPAEAEATVKMAVEEFQDASYEEWKVSSPEVAEEEAAAAPSIAVPHDMASAPAFGMDFEEPAAHVAADTQPITPPAPARSTEPITPPAEVRSAAAINPPAFTYEEPPAARSTAEMPAALQAATAAAAPELSEPPAAPAPAAEHEVEFTSHRVDHAVDHTPAPGFEPTISQEQIAAPLGRDPDLVTDTEELSHFATKFGVEGAEAVPVGVAAEIPSLYADGGAAATETPAEAAEGSADADFEARVAAAMAGYEETPTAVIETPPLAPPVPVAPPPPEPELVAAEPEPAAVAAAPEPEPQALAEPAEAETMGADTAALIAQMQQAVEGLPVDTTPHEEAVAEPAPAPAPTPEPIAENVPDHALAAAMAAAVGASVEPQITAAAAPSNQGGTALDPGVIADIVHRVVERMKPDLAAEISKELEGKLKK